MKRLFQLVILLLVTVAVKAQIAKADVIGTKGKNILIQPIKHASLILQYNKKNIFIDPTGGASLYSSFGAPDFILITDIHGDHFDTKTLESLSTAKAVIIAPKAVADKLPVAVKRKKIIILDNGESSRQKSIDIEAVAMYNLPETADSRHPKGRGNGYILYLGGKKIYISGDTEGIAEMRGLKDIDVAFVCMNLPYTMDVEQAADAVLEFKPKVVYPYHSRGQDTEHFKKIVTATNNNIEVRLKNWYPDNL